jgi:hypothetical protein
MVELGNDDGSADWSAPLPSAEQRIRKRICLSSKFHEYQRASLKIFMNHAGRGASRLSIFCDDVPIDFSDGRVSTIPEWHEIPIDVGILEGKSSVNVYLRLQDTHDERNILQVWGDRHTPTTQSVFGLERTADLSAVEGEQTGEYMIRLVLWK